MTKLNHDKNRRVLVIDDNRSIHDDFRKILSPATATAAAMEAAEMAVFGQPVDAVQQTQFEVDSAYQGQEGVLLVKRAIEAGRPYAMAFVDVRMPPGWDGVETTRKLWELDPSLQVVLCTAYSDYSWGEMFEKLGQRDGLLILKKPFDAVEALQLAQALTEKWWLHRQFQRKMEELEGRVAERTGELQESNKALQREVIEHTRAEQELQLKTVFLEALVNNDVLGILVVDQTGKKSLQNQRFVDLFKIPPPIAHEKADENRLRWITDMTKNPTQFIEKVRHLYAHPQESSHDEIELKDGTTLERYSSPVAGKDGTHYGRAWTFRNITERKRFESQLIQSQKLETVGRLAGGIAHEFNSLLTAIIGQSELLLRDLPAGSPLAKNAAEISQAAGRAATLTRQLLAYGRKQMLQPEILSLNDVLASMKDMFAHITGDDVRTQIVPAPGLHAVKADAGQIEQVIMDMVVNARDAMPNGGKITLETANVSLDQESAGHYPELKAGEYVMLAITDTGAGMSEKVKARLFEPFFTTKGVGEGTGLGLSTCYGIIKQSGGHISVDSELGRGTAFKIYLPQAPEQRTIPLSRLNSSDAPRGTETILLVEDDPALREMAAALLRRLGYTVLAAANGIEALGLKQPCGLGPIDLLFTDVVMPHMSGKELADRVRALYPQARILFSSAYTENAIVHQAVLDKSVALLQKPFTPSALAHKLREMLDQPIAPEPNAAQATFGFTKISAEAKTPKDGSW
jgi:two-component system cell cycle sensor histidine kinase/response regulator CckA